MSIFLGKPNSKTEDFIKDQWCDIFIKDDGTKVRPAYDATKTMVNLYSVEDYQNIKHFGFGKSYNDIDNLYYYDKQHGIDLSRTKIESFEYLPLGGNQLTAFSLPVSLTRFDILNLNRNQLTAFSLPVSLTRFYELYLDSNQLTAFSLPDSLTSFSYLTLCGNQLTAFSLPNSLTSFESLYLYNNQLTAFSLPDSLTSFSYLYLDSNQLTAFSLPVSLTRFDILNLNRNQLTAFSLPVSLTRFYELELDNTCNLDCTACTSVPTIQNGIYDLDYNTWQGTVLVRDATQKAAFEADKKWKQYKIQIKE